MDVAVELDPDNLRPSLVYQHLIRVIVPRPIAWVSTVSSSGVTNIAPFSFFSGVGSRPPSVVFCPANRRDGSPKDTLFNIRSVGQFVINIVTPELASVMNQSSTDLPSEESEFEAFQIPVAPSHRVQPPRVPDSPVQLECELIQSVCLDDGPGGANLVIGRVVWMHLHDSILSSDGFADPSLLDAVGRLGGETFCRTRDVFDIPRP
jgi:flavin reductase (DIM6/NTAB) family NADH-FMN oxidoreductase RutF